MVIEMTLSLMLKNQSVLLFDKSNIYNNTNVGIYLDNNLIEPDTQYTYLGHIICDDLSDEMNIKAKERSLYIKSNILF